jgi:hypothetical protein
MNGASIFGQRVLHDNKRLTKRTPDPSTGPGQAVWTYRKPLDVSLQKFVAKYVKFKKGR